MRAALPNCSQLPLRRNSFTFVTLLLTFALLPLAYGQGFGAFKMDISLQRKRPPKTVLVGTLIAVMVNGAERFEDGNARLIKSRLEKMLIAGDARLSVDEDAPETLFTCNVMRFSSSSRSETRTKSEYKKTGEKEEYNEKKKKTEKKDIYGYVNVEHRYEILEGDAEVQFEIKDTQGGSPLGSGTARSHYAREFENGKGSPGPGHVSEQMLKEVCAEIASCVVATTEPVKVLLPKGKLEAASKMLEDRLWQSALETLQAMPPLDKPKDDAYRFYDIGVAYEAMAYHTKDVEAARKHLEQAAVNYGKAAEMKPDEKYFREPQVRIETSMQQYKILADQISAAEVTRQNRRPSRPAASQGHIAPRVLSPLRESANPPSRGVTESAVTKTESAAAQSEALTNEVIIKLVKAGLSEDNVIATIAESKTNRFDLSPNALLTLMQSGVNNRIISAMRSARK